MNQSYSLRALTVLLLFSFCWLDMFGTVRRRERAERTKNKEDEKGFFQQQLEKQLTLKPYQMKQLFYILLASLFQIAVTAGLVATYSALVNYYPAVNVHALGVGMSAIWIAVFAVVMGIVFKQK